jgi:hypothetical protein
MSMPLRLGYTAAIAISTACIARLFEGRRHAVALEAIRSVLLLGPMAMGLWFHALSPAGRAAAAVALMLSLGCLAMYQKELTRKSFAIPESDVRPEAI